MCTNFSRHDWLFTINTYQSPAVVLANSAHVRPAWEPVDNWGEARPIAGLISSQSPHSGGGGGIRTFFTLRILVARKKNAPTECLVTPPLKWVTVWAVPKCARVLPFNLVWYRGKGPQFFSHATVFAKMLANWTVSVVLTEQFKYYLNDIIPSICTVYCKYKITVL